MTTSDAKGRPRIARITRIDANGPLKFGALPFQSPGFNNSRSFAAFAQFAAAPSPQLVYLPRSTFPVWRSELSLENLA